MDSHVMGGMDMRDIDKKTIEDICDKYGITHRKLENIDRFLLRYSDRTFYEVEGRLYRIFDKETFLDEKVDSLGVAIDIDGEELPRVVRCDPFLKNNGIEIGLEDYLRKNNIFHLGRRIENTFVRCEDYGQMERCIRSLRILEYIENLIPDIFDNQRLERKIHEFHDANITKKELREYLHDFLKYLDRFPSNYVSMNSTIPDSLDNIKESLEIKYEKRELDMKDRYYAYRYICNRWGQGKDKGVVSPIGFESYVEWANVITDTDMLKSRKDGFWHDDSSFEKLFGRNDRSDFNPVFHALSKKEKDRYLFDSKNLIRDSMHVKDGRNHLIDHNGYDSLDERCMSYVVCSNNQAWINHREEKPVCIISIGRENDSYRLYVDEKDNVEDIVGVVTEATFCIFRMIAMEQMYEYSPYMSTKVMLKPYDIDMTNCPDYLKYAFEKMGAVRSIGKDEYSLDGFYDNISRRKHGNRKRWKLIDLDEKK